MEKLLNKHLQKIINQYIIFKLPFTTELINKTYKIYENVQDWRHYGNKIIKYDCSIDNRPEIEIGYIFGCKYKIYSGIFGYSVCLSGKQV